MAGFNLEVSGVVRSTNAGNVDWYYGGGEEAWVSEAAARLGVPSAIRPGKTVGVLESNQVVEYIWHPSNISDGGLVPKTADLTIANVTGLQAALDDHSINIEQLTAGEILVAGDIVYLNSNGRYHKASNTAESTARGDLRVALASIALGAVGSIAKQIVITIPTTTIPIGDVVYLGANGGYIDTAARNALTTGQQSRRVGIITSATTLYFDPDRTTLELA